MQSTLKSSAARLLDGIIDQVDEGSLVEAARNGDRDALDRLVDAISPRLLRFSLRLCGQPEDAEDVLQESLLAAARAIPSFRGESSLSTWLFSIARSFCIKKRRRKRSVVAVSMETEEGAGVREVATSDPSPFDALENARIASALEEAFARLDVPHREVLLFRDVEGLSATDTARAMGLSVAAVKSRLHRARSAVRQDLAPLLAGAVAPPRSGCPDIVRLFSRHLEGEIAPRTCAEMERHLSGCTSCEATCKSLKTTLALCRSLPLPAVPTDLQERIRSQVRAFVSSEPFLSPEALTP
jgi:RNA polymerase sigma-70 factor (ECF subfamily)